MSQSMMDERPTVDLDGLLVALVLVPRSYPRNRFYELYQAHAANEVRRRAALLRSLIADLSDGADDIELTRDGEYVSVRFRLPELGAVRTSILSDDELALVKLVLERSGHYDKLPGVDPEAEKRVRPHLLRLFSS